MNELTQRGINALKANDRASARKLLAAALQQDQNDATAWLWLAAAVDTPGQRIDCLRQVLKIDPTNQAAVKGMAALGVPVAETLGPAPTPQPAVDPGNAARMEAPSPADTPPAPAPEPPTAPSGDAGDPGRAPLAVAGSAPQAALAATPAVAYRPTRSAEVAEEDARKIFKVRPSNVPALLAFWVFFFGALFVGSRVNALNPNGTFQSEGPMEGMPFIIFGLFFALVLGLLLEMVVLFVVIRNMRTNYELTSASLTIPFHGRRTRIPVRDIYHVECQQGFFQRLYGAGDVLLDAAVRGELARVRLRSVPGCEKRVQEIAYLIHDTAGAPPSGGV